MKIAPNITDPNFFTDVISDSTTFGEVLGSFIPRVFAEFETPHIQRPILGAALVCRLADRYAFDARPQPCHAFAYNATAWADFRAGRTVKHRDRPLENERHIVVRLGGNTLDVGLSIFRPMGDPKHRYPVLPPSAQYPDRLVRGTEMAWTIGRDGETVTYVATTDDSFRRAPQWRGALADRYAALCIRRLEAGRI